MIRALVITHGDIGREMVQVVEMILGPTEGLQALSNHGKSVADLKNDIQTWLTQTVADDSESGVVLMIDDCGGSCATASQLACGEESGCVILSGVNLAMLLGFMTWRETTEFSDLSRKLVQKSREAIIQVGGR